MIFRSFNKFTYAATTMVILAVVPCAVARGEVYSESNKKGWLVKIGNEEIKLEDLNRFYYMQNKILANFETNEEVDRLASDPESLQLYPYLEKQNFLEILINEKLVYSTATGDKSIDQNELKTVIELAKYQAVLQYYMMKKLKNKIVVTDEEINEFYEIHRDSLSKYTYDEAREVIRKYLVQRKINDEMMKYIQELKEREGVNRDGFTNYMSGLNK